MSSPEHSDREFTKKRKISRSCDVCRRRKIDCDGPDVPGHRCSVCLAGNLKCTYKKSLKSREADQEYVRALEERLRKTEALLNELRANNSTLDASTTSHTSTSTNVSGGQRSSLPHVAPATGTSSSLISLAHGLVQSPDDGDAVTEEEGAGSDDDRIESVGTSLAEYLAELKLDPSSPRFIGKSSGASLIASALELKYKHHLETTEGGEAADEGTLDAAGLKTSAMTFKRRAEFWGLQDWERESLESVTNTHPRRVYEFPEPDLMPILVEYHFSECNSLLALLHRPSFDAAVADGLHFRDDGFASVLLLVCAIGSGYVNDPRVMLDITSGHSAGWKWFSQVTLNRNSLLSPPSLFDIQIYCLAHLFLQSSSAPQAYWTLMGSAIRMAMDIGIHRRKVYNGPPSAYDEQWKRAFWTLVVYDRFTSWFMGRPSAVQDEDVDLDLPLEVDDEYWDHPDPSLRFQQPLGKPSRVSAFVNMIKLAQILGFALKTIYSIKRSKFLVGFVVPDWEEQNVSQLNSALNEWMDRLPEHIRWDPKQKDSISFHQSAMLHSCYYIIQLTIHRPFLPKSLQQRDLDAFDMSGSKGKGKSSSMAVPALAICTSSARSCARVVHEHSVRNGGLSPMHIAPAFHAALFLLLNLWGVQKLKDKSTPEITGDMEHIQNCMDALQGCENTWSIAGRFRDILTDLTGVQRAPSVPPIDAPRPALTMYFGTPVNADGSTPPFTFGSADTPTSTTRTPPHQYNPQLDSNSPFSTVPPAYVDQGHEQPVYDFSNFGTFDPLDQFLGWGADMASNMDFTSGAATNEWTGLTESESAGDPYQNLDWDFTQSYQAGNSLAEQ